MTNGRSTANHPGQPSSVFPELHIVTRILAELVRVPSISDRSNLPVLDIIERHLGSEGFHIERVPYLDSKENLIARIGPEGSAPIILSGHTDVVPVEGQSWTSDPFTLTRRAGAWYGRGSADMKGFLAICLALAPFWRRARLKRPIHLVFSPDEEIGCRGVVPAVRRLSEASVAPWGVIVGEPTGMDVVTREKGNVTLETEVIGVAGHSANPAAGVNAIVTAARLIDRIDTISSHHIVAIDGAFDVPNSTVNIGLIEGGLQKNIIPDRCVFRWEVRPVSSQSLNVILLQVEQEAAKIRETTWAGDLVATIRTRVLNRVPSLSETTDSAFLSEVMLAAGRKGSSAVSFASEAGHYQSAGFPTVLCGPGRMAVAHKADEHITEPELLAGLKFLRRLTCI